MRTWQLQQAKAHLSKVIEAAKKEGPQIITQRGVKTAVLLPFEEPQEMQQEKKPTLLQILQSCPQGDLPIPPRSRWKRRKLVKF